MRPYSALLPFRLSPRTVEFFMKEFPVNPASNRDTASLCQFLIHSLNEFISVGFRYSQLLSHFVHTHKNLSCHTKKYLPFLVVIVSRLPFHPSDSGRQPFPALCRLFFSLARSCRRLLPRRKYLSDGHSVFQCLKFPLSPYNG